MSYQAYAFLAGYLNKEAKDTIPTAIGGGAVGALGGGAAGALGSLAGGPLGIDPEEETSKEKIKRILRNTLQGAAIGGAGGTIAGGLAGHASDNMRSYGWPGGLQALLFNSKEATEVKGINKEATGPASRWIEPNITPPQTDTDIKKGKGFQEGFMNMLRARIKEDKQKPITSAGPVRGEASRLLEEFQNLRSLARKPRTRIK